MPSVGKINFTGNVISPEVVNPRTFAEAFLKEKELKAQMLQNMPKSVKFLDKMKSFVGEVPNIIINAVGTGLVAPVFIKHNFMSNTDDDTRTYTAWRQPVSAVLAVITQAGLVIPFNHIVDNMTNKGEFSDLKFNKTAFQDEDFHKKQIRKENPSLTKEEVSKLVKERQQKQMEDIVEKLYNENTIELKTKGGKVVKLNETQINDLLKQTTEDWAKKSKDNKAEQEIVKQMQQAIKEKKSIKDIHKISKGIKDSNFVYDIAQKHISNITANIKGEKQFKGLLVSLAILPVTCCLLNWLYPKFMDLAFPNLSTKKQKPKQEDTFAKSEAPAVKKGGA